MLEQNKTGQWSFLFFSLFKARITQTLQSGENLTVRNEWAAAVEHSLEGFHCRMAVPDIRRSSLLCVGTPSSDSSLITPAQTRPSWVYFGGSPTPPAESKGEPTIQAGPVRRDHHARFRGGPMTQAGPL